VASWPRGFRLMFDRLKAASLPPVPFDLRPGVRVVDAELFRRSLVEEAMLGPGTPRAETGALQQDIRELLDHCPEVQAVPAPAPERAP